MHLGDSVTEVEALAIGRKTADELNAWWRDVVLREHRLQSHLELRFDLLLCAS